MVLAALWLTVTLAQPGLRNNNPGNIEAGSNPRGADGE